MKQMSRMQAGLLTTIMSLILVGVLLLQTISAFGQVVESTSTPDAAPTPPAGRPETAGTTNPTTVQSTTVIATTSSTTSTTTSPVTSAPVSTTPPVTTSGATTTPVQSNTPTVSTGSTTTATATVQGTTPGIPTPSITTGTAPTATLTTAGITTVPVTPTKSPVTTRAATATPKPTATEVVNTVPEAGPPVEAPTRIVKTPSPTISIPEISLTPSPELDLITVPSEEAPDSPIPTQDLTETPTPIPTPIPGAPSITGLSPDSGPIDGTTVVITGANFNEVTAVTFDGVDAAGFEVIDSTSISATAPAHTAGSVIVRVVTSYAVVSAPVKFTYTGSLSLVSNTAPTYKGSITYTDVVTTSEFSVTVDNSTGKGWRLLVSSSPLTSEKASLPVENQFIDSVSISGDSNLANSGNLKYPLVFPVEETPIFATSGSTGSGLITLTFHTHLVIPAYARAGNYQGSFNITLFSEP